MKNVPFKLTHVVLWLKGWYEHTDNKWNDLSLMLELDGFPGYKSKEDITRCLVYHYQEWCNTMNKLNIQKRDIYSLYVLCSSPSSKGDFYDKILDGISSDWKFCKYMTMTRPVYTEKAFPNNTSSVLAWEKEAKKNKLKTRKDIAEFYNNKIKHMPMWKDDYIITK
jgi:hypothetical protein